MLISLVLQIISWLFNYGVNNTSNIFKANCEEKAITNYICRYLRFGNFCFDYFRFIVPYQVQKILKYGQSRSYLHSKGPAHRYVMTDLSLYLITFFEASSGWDRPLGVAISEVSVYSGVGITGFDCKWT